MLVYMYLYECYMYMCVRKRPSDPLELEVQLTKVSCLTGVGSRSTIDQVVQLTSNCPQSRGRLSSPNPPLFFFFKADCRPG